MVKASKAGVGWSRLSHSFKAGVEAARAALDSCGDLPPVFVLVYATVIYDHKEVLRGVASVLPPGVPQVGCSTQGVTRPGGVEEVDRVVGVAIVASNAIRAATGCAEGLSRDPREAGHRLAEQLGPASDADVDFVWYDPVSGVNVDGMLQGLAEKGHHRVLGGGASHTWMVRQNATQQFFNGRVLSDAAVGLRLSGAQVISEVSHGTEPVGLELTVTQSEGNVVKALDGRPALDVWMEHLGGGDMDDQDTRMAWALGLTLPPGASDGYDDTIVTRGVFNADKRKKTLSFQSDIPSGSRVQICHRTRKSVFSRAVAMAEKIRRRMEGQRPLLALSFECGARPRPFLGDEKSQEELLAVQGILGKDLPWLGHYAWGEISPIGKKCYLYNFTFPLIVLCDAP